MILWGWWEIVVICYIWCILTLKLYGMPIQIVYMLSSTINLSPIQTLTVGARFALAPPLYNKVQRVTDL